jgi:hypothetical protein
LKKILVFLSLTVSMETFAQSHSTDSVVVFCQRSFAIPGQCATPSKGQIFCDDYFMYWFYPAQSILSATVKTFVDKFSAEMGNCHKDSTQVYLLNQKVTAIKLTCVASGISTYQYIAYGLVNNQPVMVVLSLRTDPKSNNDLPGPIRQILTVE